MSSVLITGAGGFLGSFLAEHLAARGHAVTGTAYRPSPHLNASAAPYRVVACDVRDAAGIAALVAELRPEVVYHLAAKTHPMQSWDDAAGTVDVNVTGTLRLLDAVRAHAPGARLVLLGSSAEYGAGVGGETPVDEHQPLRPVTPYAVSKVAAFELTSMLARRHGLHAVWVRPFWVTGPRAEGTVCPDWARAILALAGRAAAGAPPTMLVGNLELERDFLDVHDAVRALEVLGERGEAGEVYNLAAGRRIRLREVFETLCRLVGCEVRAEVDPARVRPDEMQVVVGDNSKLHALGWVPEVPLEQTLREIVAYWRERGPA